MSAKIGIVGLGVMGHNLALNMERNGFPVAGYDLDCAKTKAFLDGPPAHLWSRWRNLGGSF